MDVMDVTGLWMGAAIPAVGTEVILHASPGVAYAGSLESFSAVSGGCVDIAVRDRRGQLVGPVRCRAPILYPDEPRLGTHAQRERSQLRRERVAAAIGEWDGLTSYLATVHVFIEICTLPETDALVRDIYVELTGESLVDGSPGYTIFKSTVVGTRWGTKWVASFLSPPPHVPIPEFDSRSGLGGVVRLRACRPGVSQVNSVDYVKHLLANGFRVGNNAPREGDQ
jgi:hypothetical protein